MNEPRTEFERWAELVDRQADDQVLSADELAFCSSFEQTHPMCARREWELAVYAELADLGGTPTEASRALVDRALAQLEAEEAAHAVAEVQALRRPRVANWRLWTASTIAVGVCAAFALRASNVTPANTAQAHSAQAAQDAHAAQDARENGVAQPLARTELVYASGTVSVAGAETGVGRTLLTDGSVIETASGSACVLIDSDINICLAAHSRMRLSAIATAARRVELEAGKLATRLATQPDGMSLTIMADGVASTAVGTAFSVERTVDHAVVTTVLNGKVRVGRGVDTVLVNAHERAVSRRADNERGDNENSGAAVSSVSRSDEAPSWALLGPSVLWHDPVAATLEVHGTPAGVDTWLDEQLIGITPLSSLIPTGQHRLVVRRGTEVLAVQELNTHAGGSQEVVYDAATSTNTTNKTNKLTRQQLGRSAAKHGAAASRSRARSQTVPANHLVQHAADRLADAPTQARTHAAGATDAVQVSASEEEPISGAEWLRRARQAMRAGHFADAGAAYETLIKSYSKSDEARAALVLLGQLRLTQLHDAHGALEVLNSYLEQGGSLEVEARVARIEALHQLKRPADEAAAIDEFLQRHPRSFEAKALRARVGVPRDSQ